MSSATIAATDSRITSACSDSIIFSTASRAAVILGPSAIVAFSFVWTAATAIS